MLIKCAKCPKLNKTKQIKSNNNSQLQHDCKCALPLFSVASQTAMDLCDGALSTDLVASDTPLASQTTDNLFGYMLF